MSAMTMNKRQYAATKSQFLALPRHLARALESRVRKAGYWAEADKLVAAA